jgi:serine/threonine-protein kinase
MGRPKAAIEALDRALQIAPDLAIAWELEAISYLELEDVNAAHRAYDRCLEVSPAATECLRDQNELDALEGDCLEAETISRRTIALDPEGPTGYRLLARALSGRGQSEETVLAALEQAWRRTPASERHATELADRTKLAIAGGRFEEAVRLANDWERAVASEPDDWAHMRAWRHHALLELEMGANDAAAKGAQAYAKRRAGWAPNDMIWDTSILAVQIEYRAGAIAKSRAAAERTQWLAAEAERANATGQSMASVLGERWQNAYVQMAVTPDDAREALSVADRFLPLPDPLNRDVTFEMPLGHVYLLAGDPKSALAPLRRAARACTAMESPVWQRWAILDYGLALEATGDPAGACTSYRDLLAAWGTAKPRSLSAEKARARVAALRCAP